MKLLILIRNNLISFFKEESAEISLLSENYLYFYYDKFAHKLKNHKNYRIFLSEKKENFYSGVLNSLSESDNISIKGEDKSPFFLISVLISNMLKDFNPNEVLVSYANNIKKHIRNKLNNLFSSLFEKTQFIEDFSVLAAKNYIKSNKIINPLNNFYLFLQQEDDIIVDNLNFDGKDIEVKKSQKIDDIAYNPYTYELAKKICSNIYKIYKPKNSVDLIENIHFIYLKLEDKTNSVFSKNKNIVVFSSKLKNDKQNYVTNVKKEEIKISTKVFVNKFINKIIKNVDAKKDARIILVGDFFREDLILEELKDKFSDVSLLNEKDIFSTRNQPLQVQSDEYSTMFLPKDKAEKKDKSESEKIATLKIDELDIGEQIKLSNYDSRPGKGESMQLFEFLGDAKFVVVESTRSLKTGDIVVAEDKVWHQGIKLILVVHRNGKKYGRFQTREIQTIELLK